MHREKALTELMYKHTHTPEGQKYLDIKFHNPNNSMWPLALPGESYDLSKIALKNKIGICMCTSLTQ